MKQALLFIVLAITIASCKKSDENAYSKWYVGKDTFLTNNVIKEASKVSLMISDYNRPTYFDFSFSHSRLTDGEGYLLVNSNPPTQCCFAGFIVSDTISYSPSPTSRTSIRIDMSSGKATWTMRPTWCINFNNSNDSVLVGGNFSEP